MARISIGPDPLRAGDLLDAFGAANRQAGAITSFVGQVRPSNGEGPVTALELQHYSGFTERRIAEEAKSIVSAHDLLDILVAHRTGHIAAGEIVVVAAAAAAHRRAAFEALDRLMDWLKRIGRS